MIWLCLSQLSIFPGEPRIVSWFLNGDVKCSCCKRESSGIVCCHILAVYAAQGWPLYNDNMFHSHWKRAIDLQLDLLPSKSQIPQNNFLETTSALLNNDAANSTLDIGFNDSSNNVMDVEPTTQSSPGGGVEDITLLVNSGNLLSPSQPSGNVEPEVHGPPTQSKRNFKTHIVCSYQQLKPWYLFFHIIIRRTKNL